MRRMDQRMERLFSLDGKLMSVLSTISDFLIAGVLWFIFSLPVITIGASTAALFSTVFQLIKQEDTGPAKSFLRAFGEHFRRATVIWLIWLALGAFLALDLYFYLMWSATGETFGIVLFSAFFGLCMLYVCVGTYLFPYTVVFSSNLRRTFTNSAYLSFRHLPVTLLMVIINLALLLLCLAFPVLFIVLPGALGAVDGMLLYRTFSRYVSKAADVTKSVN